MTKNKKKLRRVERRYSVTKSAQTLVLAGMLLAGGVTGAMAAVTPPTSLWDQETVTINDAKTFSTSIPMMEDVEGVVAKNINTTVLNIVDGGHLTLTNGARLAHYNYASRPGTAGMNVTMTGGTLTITNGTGFSSIDANLVTISGGEVKLTGKRGNAWENAAYVGAYKGMDIRGGEINMGENSHLFAGGHLHITGGTINMDGTASGNNAAHIMFTGGEDNIIGGNAIIKVTTGKYGVMSIGRKLEITGTSQIKVEGTGNLLLQAGVTRGQALGTVSGEKSTINQTGGTVTVANGGALTVAQGVNYTQTGGSLKNASTVLVNGVLNLRGGTVDATTNTGTINVVNLASGGSDVGRLEVTDTQLGQLAATGKVSVAGNGSGTPSASDSWGRIHLGENATLDAGLLKGSDTANKVVVDSHGSIQAQNLTLTGNALAINTNARIKINKLTLTPSTNNGDFTLSSGQIFLKGERDSALTVTGTGGLLLDGSSNRAELKLGDENEPGVIVGGSINSNVTANGANAKVKVQHGTWTLAAGKTLDIQANSVLTVGGETGDAGKLVIEGTLKSVAAGNGPQSSGGSGGSTPPTAGINVLQNGVLEADSGKLMKDATTIADNLNKIWLDNGGVLKVTGLTSISTTDMAAYKTALVAGGTGLINYGSATVEVSAADKTAAGNLDGAKAEDTSALLAGNTVEYSAGSGSATINGGYGADSLLLNGATGDIASQTISGDLTLLGDDNGNLIAAEKTDGSTVNVTEVAVAAGKNLNLGSAGATSKGGTLDSKVTLGNGSALNAAVANYTVGAIDGNGAVAASANANLTADSIGATTAVANVEAKGGNVVSNGIIKTGTLTAENGGVQATTLTTTGNVALTDGGLNLTSGTSASTVGGTLGLNNTQAEVKDLTVNGAATIDGGSLTGKDVTLTGGGAISNGAQVTVNTLVGTGQTITVGSDTDTNATSLTVTTLDMTGGKLFIDPSWTSGSNVVAAGSFDSGTVDVLAGVGQNSMLLVGSTDSSWLTAQVNAVTNGAGLTQTGVSAALGIYTAQVLNNTNGAFEVDGSKNNTDFSSAAPSPNSLTFSGQSLLVVNADAALDPKGALSSDAAGTAVVKDGAKLRIANAKVNQTYTVLGTNITTTYTDASGGASNPGQKGWTGSNLSTDSNMVLLNQKPDGTFGTTMASATGIFHGMSDQMGKIVEKMYGSNLHNPHSSNAGIRFASRATMPDYLSADQAAATIEGAAQLAVVGAAPAMTLSAVQAGTSTVTTRTSFASPLLDSSKAVALHKDVDGTLSVDSGLNAGNGMKNGFGLWIMPLYQSNSAWGMKADGFKGGYKSDLGGVALGADYTVNDMFRFGLAFNIGGGYAESNGDFNKTENSFNFWGINAYGGWTMNNFGITADVGYTGNYNKLQQELPGSMGMGDIKSDVNSSAWTAGLRGEYKFATEALDIIPHVGVRYTGLTTDEYKAKSGGDTVFKVDQDFQSIWTFPIGVTLAKEIETGSGWIVRPQVDLGITPAAGDVKAKSKVRIPGVDAQAEMKMQVVDYMSYDGGVGLEMKKDNISFGVNYNIQASEHRTGHGVFGTFRYEF